MRVDRHGEVAQVFISLEPGIECRSEEWQGRKSATLTEIRPISSTLKVVNSVNDYARHTISSGLGGGVVITYEKKATSPSRGGD